LFEGLQQLLGKWVTRNHL